MERLPPQDKDTGKTGFRGDFMPSLLPTVLGKDADGRLHIKVRFGEEIEFNDLIQEHITRHNKLWKYSGEVINDKDRNKEEGRRHDGEGRRRDNRRRQPELLSCHWC